MKILVNGIKKELVTIGSNCIERTQDLFGNANVLDYNEDLEQYTMSDDDFDWWSEYIDNANADEVRIAELAEQFEDEVADGVSI